METGDVRKRIEIRNKMEDKERKSSDTSLFASVLRCTMCHYVKKKISSSILNKKSRKLNKINDDNNIAFNDSILTSDT